MIYFEQKNLVCYHDLTYHVFIIFDFLQTLIAVVTGKHAIIEYGGESISGYFSEDNIKVGDIVIEDQEFIEATREPGITFLGGKFDGILGLGFKENSIDNSIPVWLVGVGLATQSATSTNTWSRTRHASSAR
ncbi:unnamed protein product [Lactuca saligna]|uniref:Peptidase A1 domain-containing protein n=1 Tax=Lactuca saligna TaxID=75948 RepID=A0AA35YTM5_LACSI|nr:unnamed protein product [Lactuca saligna]